MHFNKSALNQKKTDRRQRCFFFRGPEKSRTDQKLMTKGINIPEIDCHPKLILQILVEYLGK